MSSPLPKPLIPSNIDLRGFEYMPLDVVRLRDSDFTALNSAEGFRAGILLWCASWHQVPAGSLPSDDRVLSNLAGYGRVVKEWEKVKDEALHGWVLCDDGRYYHPVICEKAVESWVSKQEYNYKKFADRLRKKNGNLKKDGFPEIEIPDLHDWISAGMPKDWDNNSKTVPSENNQDSLGKENNSCGNPSENALKGTEQNLRDNNIYNPPQGAGADTREKMLVDTFEPQLHDVNIRLNQSGHKSIDAQVMQRELSRFRDEFSKNSVLYPENWYLGRFSSWIMSNYPSRQASKSTKTSTSKTSGAVNQNWPGHDTPQPIGDDFDHEAWQARFAEDGLL